MLKVGAVSNNASNDLMHMSCHALLKNPGGTGEGEGEGAGLLDLKSVKGCRQCGLAC